jgi:hypothetical protein
MRPLGHLTASTGISVAIYAKTGSLSMAAVQMGFGIFIDLDHVIEFICRNKKILNPRKFFLERANESYNHVVFMFHSWELAIIAGLAGVFIGTPLIGAMITLGMVQHLAMDQWRNSTKPLSYFILFRAKHGFLSEPVFPPREKGKGA